MSQNVRKRASNEDSDQPAHPGNLIRVFVACMKKVPLLSKMHPVK